MRTINDVKRFLTPLTEDEIERRDRASVEEDVAPWRGSTVEERVEAVRALLRLASKSLANDEHEAAARRDWQDPRSAASEALWRSLVAAHRKQ